jgi:hypothetical protein
MAKVRKHAFNILLTALNNQEKLTEATFQDLLHAFIIGCHFRKLSPPQVTAMLAKHWSIMVEIVDPKLYKDKPGLLKYAPAKGPPS